MNFLAHAWLSGNHPEVMAGNVLGDFFKGRIHEGIPREFRAGLLLHRHIDSITDTHVATTEIRKLLMPYYGRYSGVAADVWMDHILARDFETHHTMTLAAFSKQVYDALDKYGTIRIPEAGEFISLIKENNWLVKYQSEFEIPVVLKRMSVRFNAPALSGPDYPDTHEIEHIALHFNDLKKYLILNSTQKLADLLSI